jgi:RHS repeat-associated protein
VGPIQTIRGYDQVTGRIDFIQSGTGGSSTLQNLNYQWDTAGSLTERQDVNQSLTEHFYYDDLHRLDYSTRNGVTNLDLAYNQYGNITSKTGVGTPGPVYTDTLHYLLKDSLGSTDVITTAAGAVTVRESFDGFGKRRGTNWTGNPTAPELTTMNSTTRRGFTFHEHLDSVDLIHMNGRVYDPFVGRFVSPDPFIDGELNTQGWNRYSYVHNRPLSFTDPSGFDTEKEVKVNNGAGGGGGFSGFLTDGGRGVFDSFMEPGTDPDGLQFVTVESGSDRKPPASAPLNTRIPIVLPAPRVNGPDPYVQTEPFTHKDDIWYTFTANPDFEFKMDALTLAGNQSAVFTAITQYLLPYESSNANPPRRVLSISTSGQIHFGPHFAPTRTDIPGPRQPAPPIPQPQFTVPELDLRMPNFDLDID